MSRPKASIKLRQRPNNLANKVSERNLLRRHFTHHNEQKGNVASPPPSLSQVKPSPILSSVLAIWVSAMIANETKLLNGVHR